MAGKVRYLQPRDGRYYARLAVPERLRKTVGKRELRTPLGADRREALKLLPGAVAQLQHQIAQAERKVGHNAQRETARYPLAPDQIALSHYRQRLAFDDELRNDPRYAIGLIDDLLVSRLREAIAGRLSDLELAELIGAQVERFRALGNVDAKTGSDEWRVIARALCSAELEALERVAERDEGDFSGTPTNPLLASAEPPEDRPTPVSLEKLWNDYVVSRKAAGSMRDGGQRQRPVIKNLRKFLKHDDAARITKRDLLSWRDHLMKSLSAKTVSDIYLSAVRSLFLWAFENERLPENVAASVKQSKPRKVYNRERGYTDVEATNVLKKSRAYEPKVDEWGKVREAPQFTAAKQWVPIICAFTGARVSEITQLRAEDIRKEGKTWIVRITPDAGTVKAGGYRDIPLHSQIIEEGFAELVLSSKKGPLFHNAKAPKDYATKSQRVSNRLATWLRTEIGTPAEVAPNHAWRHRLKTQCLELGISGRVMDAIQGHAGRTAGDNYGDVTLKAKTDAITKLPRYQLA